MIDYLRGSTDEVTKTDVVRRIGELAERFAPDTQWFLDTMNQVSSSLLQAQVSMKHALRCTSDVADKGWPAPPCSRQ